MVKIATMNYRWILAILAAIGLLVWLVSSFEAPPKLEVIDVSDYSFEVVDTLKEREQGLSGRTEVPEDGMLFVFPEKNSAGFWMKDMLISIDIIWIGDGGTIIGIEENVSPDTYPEAFYPPEPVRYVLEVAAGDAKARSWEVGTIIPLP
jgi:uncharacterized protein